MTLRQVVGLIKIIRKSEMVEFYNDLLSYGTIHGVKLPSINEFLGASLEHTEEKTPFTKDVDEALEREAFKRLEERRQSRVK